MPSTTTSLPAQTLPAFWRVVRSSVRLPPVCPVSETCAGVMMQEKAWTSTGLPGPARPLPSYIGSFANDYWGPATVAVQDGALTLTLGPRPKTYRLAHWDGDVFTFALDGENAPPGSLSKAAFDGDRLRLEYFDSDKMGTFTR